MIIYNEAASILTCLDALQKRGFDHFVILDMCSTDGSQDIIREALGDRAVIRVITRDVLLRLGYAEARNICAANASRDWVLFVDADEVIISGAEHGIVTLSSESPGCEVFAIERNNLTRDPENGPDAIRIRSVEHHNRLYKPSFKQEWVGYIHEEIRPNPLSVPRPSGRTDLVFDHYSELKLSVDLDKKEGLYAVMPLRAFHQPIVRAGMPDWYHTVYTPANRQLLEQRAAAYADDAGIPAAFYGPDNTDDAGSQVPPPTPVSMETSPGEEGEWDVTPFRTLRHMQVEKWTGAPHTAFWGEWDHPGEGTRTIEALMTRATDWNWPAVTRGGRLLVDVGAYTGDTAIPLAILGYTAEPATKARIVVVEPNPAAIAALRTNLAMNAHIAAFTLIEAAATGQSGGEVELGDHDNRGCNGGILAGGYSKTLETRLDALARVRYKARALSLEAILVEAGGPAAIHDIGFVKLNCAGHDKEVLRPARDLLAVAKPALFIDWFEWFEDEDDHDLFKTVTEVDYVAFNPTTLRPATITELIPGLLCFHKDHIPDFVPAF
jgi:FkbM family methyltransferase